MRGKTRRFIPSLREQHQARLQAQSLGFYFIYLFKYLATFGSASPACTRGTTLEQEKETFSVLNFLAPNTQMTAICWNTNPHAPTPPGAPILTPHSAVWALVTPSRRPCGGYTKQLISVTVLESCSSTLKAAHQWLSLSSGAVCW